MKEHDLRSRRDFWYGLATGERGGRECVCERVGEEEEGISALNSVCRDDPEDDEDENSMDEDDGIPHTHFHSLPTLLHSFI